MLSLPVAQIKSIKCMKKKKKNRGKEKHTPSVRKRKREGVKEGERERESKKGRFQSGLHRPPDSGWESKCNLSQTGYHFGPTQGPSSDARD